MKKTILFLIAVGGFFIFGQSKALEPSRTDQACANIRNGYSYYNVNTERPSQIFSPSRNTLDSVVIALRTPSGLAKAKVRVYNVTSVQTAGIIAEKLISVQGNSAHNYTVDFTDVTMPSGIYALAVEPVHQEEIVLWSATDGGCYSRGYANIDGQPREEVDMLFAVKTYDTVAPTSNIPQASGNSNSAPSTNQSEETSAPTSPAPAQSTVGVNKVEESAPDNPIVDKNTDINEKTEYSQNLTNDKELQETIALVLKMIEEDKYKGGAFGLQGVVGRFLTWPVFITISGILLVLLVFTIIMSTRKSQRASKDSKN